MMRNVTQVPENETVEHEFLLRFAKPKTPAG